MCFSLSLSAFTDLVLVLFLSYHLFTDPLKLDIFYLIPQDDEEENLKRETCIIIMQQPRIWKQSWNCSALMATANLPNNFRETSNLRSKGDKSDEPFGKTAAWRTLCSTVLCVSFFLSLWDNFTNVNSCQIIFDVPDHLMFSRSYQVFYILLGILHRLCVCDTFSITLNNQKVQTTSNSDKEPNR